MTKQEAIALADTHWWVTSTAEQIVMFQLYEERLCCPFKVFHDALTEVLGRPIFVHEFARPDLLQKELDRILMEGN